MLKYRAISFPLLLGLTALIFCWESGGKYIYLILAPLAVGLAVYEAGAMLNRKILFSFPKIGGLVSGLATLLMCITGSTDWIGSDSLGKLLTIGIPVVAIVPALIFFLTRKVEILKRISGTLGIIFMFGVPFYLTAAVFHLKLPFILMNFSKTSQISALLFLLLVTKAMDTGGYIFGMLSGKYLPGGNHKIAPSISPKKSYEGFLGGMLLSVLVAFFFYLYNNNIGLGWSLTAGVVLSFGSFFGDLTESALKRICEIKDSGSYIPGMGGAFDVLDSFIYNGALFWVLCLNMKA